MLAFNDWLLDQLDWIVPFVAVVVGVLLVVGAIAGVSVVVEGRSCRAKAEAMGVNWSFGVWQDCMIVVDGKTIPLSAYKVVKVVQ